MLNNGRITSPIDGDFVNLYDGYVNEGNLIITVKVDSSCSNLKVNGLPVIRKGGEMAAEVPVERYENILELTDGENNILHKIKIYCLKEHNRIYRLSVDDNIWFLRDIAKKRYKSIFDNEYLSFFRELNQKYGLKLHLNTYFETDGFNLSQMPDCYKDEWKANSSWLQMSFHALGDSPSNPYINSSYEEVKKHCHMVKEQIIRFAGEELLDSATTIHFGSTNRDGCLALKDSGYNLLAGYFSMHGESPIVSYYLDKKQVEHLNKRDLWMDTSNGIIFFKNDIVLNAVKLEDIKPHMDNLLLFPHESGFIEMMIHEQYFYADYSGYQPDFKDKVETAVKWVTENGYKSIFAGNLLNY